MQVFLRFTSSIFFHFGIGEIYWVFPINSKRFSDLALKLLEKSWLQIGSIYSFYTTRGGIEV